MARSSMFDVWCRQDLLLPRMAGLCWRARGQRNLIHFKDASARAQRSARNHVLTMSDGEQMSDDNYTTPVTQTEIASGVEAEAPVDEQARKAIRENAKRVIRESGIGEMLRTLNQNALQGRGWYDEYDSGVLFKWGSGVTRRHIWVDIHGDLLRFRLRPHIRCAAPVPVCDGEYHSFTPAMWRQRGAVLRELHRNYERPVAETSED